MIKYTISLECRSEHKYKVLMQFKPNSKQTTLKLPTWIPGSYMIREFSKNILSINARQNGKYVECGQINKNTWQINGYKVRTIVEIEYELYALDFGIRTAYLDNKRAYFNATSLCLYVIGYEHLTHSVNFNNLPPTWNIATAICHDEGQYLADNYDELIDSPFELGEFIRIPFKVKDTAHYLVLSGTISPCFDSQRLINDMIKICEKQIDLFGGSAPFTDYTFLLYLGGEIYTGLEHRNSTALMAPYYSLPKRHLDEINDDYLKLLSLISHEYFHLWNVKRIKPEVFNPYDFQNENYTSQLWWFEGITSYYDDLILYRAGLIDKKKYLQIILDNVNNVYKFAGVTRQSLANSSLTSWIKYYRQDENSPNSIVSYYVKGALVGLCLDLIIRKQSTKKSLNDVLRGLYNKWLRDGHGLNENEITRLIKKYTACDLSKEIIDFTTTTLPLPLTELFKDFGLELKSVKGNYTKSGKVLEKNDKLAETTVIPAEAGIHAQQETNFLKEENKLDLGIKAVKENIGYRVINVYTNSPAADAGLAANDLILAIDKVKLTDLEKQLGLYTESCQIEVTFFRQEQLRSLLIKPKANLTDVYYLKIINEKKLAAWL